LSREKCFQVVEIQTDNHDTDERNNPYEGDGDFVGAAYHVGMKVSLKDFQTDGRGGSISTMKSAVTPFLLVAE
jgi:hypothetical protein